MIIPAMFIQLIRSGLAISAGCILATNLLLTYVGEDRPGIVQELSALVSSHGEIGLRVRCREGGRLRVSPWWKYRPSVEGLRSEINQIPGLSVYLEESGVPQTDSDTLMSTSASWALTERVFYKGYDRDVEAEYQRD